MFLIPLWLVSLLITFMTHGWLYGIGQIILFLVVAVLAYQMKLEKGSTNWLDLINWLVFFGITDYGMYANGWSTIFLGVMVFLQIGLMIWKREFFMTRGITVRGVRL